MEHDGFTPRHGRLPHFSLGSYLRRQRAVRPSPGAKVTWEGFWAVSIINPPALPPCPPSPSSVSCRGRSSLASPNRRRPSGPSYRSSECATIQRWVTAPDILSELLPRPRCNYKCICTAPGVNSAQVYQTPCTKFPHSQLPFHNTLSHPNRYGGWRYAAPWAPAPHTRPRSAAGGAPC